MKMIIKNPITIWLKYLLKKAFLECNYRKKNLKIGYLSNTTKCSFGNFVTIHENVILNEVLLDDYTYIANDTKISKSKIGKFCSIGPDCKIGLGKHPSSTFVSSHPVFFSTSKQTNITFADQNYFEESSPIEIGNDVWIGADVIIVDGIEISDGAIIAGGSVVTKNIPPYAIVGGIPAKIIRYRFDENEIKYLLNFKWWNKDMKWLKTNYKLFHNIHDFIDKTTNG